MVDPCTEPDRQSGRRGREGYEGAYPTMPCGRGVNWNAFFPANDVFEPDRSRVGDPEVVIVRASDCPTL